MTILIKQRAEHDCGVAATAMYLGCDYERVIEILREGTRGAWTPDLPVNFSTELMGLRHAGQPSAIVAEFDPERPAILSILSLNLPGKLHAVYWDGSHVFDPSLALTVTNDTVFERCVSFTQRLSDLATLMLRTRRFARAQKWDANS